MQADLSRTEEVGLILLNCIDPVTSSFNSDIEMTKTFKDEKRVGFNITCGLLGLETAKLPAPVGRLVDAMRLVFEDYRHLAPKALGESQDFEAACKRIFNQFGNEIWPGTRTEWLADATSNNLGGLYTKNLSFSNDRQILEANFLDMMRCKTKSHRYRSGKGSIKEKRQAQSGDNRSDDDEEYGDDDFHDDDYREDEARISSTILRRDGIHHIRHNSRLKVQGAESRTEHHSTRRPALSAHTPSKCPQGQSNQLRSDSFDANPEPAHRSDSRGQYSENASTSNMITPNGEKLWDRHRTETHVPGKRNQEHQGGNTLKRVQIDSGRCDMVMDQNKSNHTVNTANALSRSSSHQLGRPEGLPPANEADEPFAMGESTDYPSQSLRPSVAPVAPMAPMMAPKAPGPSEKVDENDARAVPRVSSDEKKRYQEQLILLERTNRERLMRNLAENKIQRSTPVNTALEDTAYPRPSQPPQNIDFQDPSSSLTSTDAGTRTNTSISTDKDATTPYDPQDKPVDRQPIKKESLHDVIDLTKSKILLDISYGPPTTLSYVLECDFESASDLFNTLARGCPSQSSERQIIACNISVQFGKVEHTKKFSYHLSKDSPPRVFQYLKKVIDMQPDGASDDIVLGVDVIWKDEREVNGPTVLE